MDKYFKLDPYQNNYKNFLVTNKLRSELLKYKCPLLDGSSNDYAVLNNFFERRFKENLEDIFPSVFGIEFKMIETKLVFDVSHFYAESIFYNNRFGKYIHNKCAELMFVFGVNIEFERRNQLLYEIFIETCNMSNKEMIESWEMVKSGRNINSLTEFFIGRLKGEVRSVNNILYKDYYKEIIEKLV